MSPVTGAITFVGAGHLDNVILRADGQVVPLTSTGQPLGLLPPMIPYGETSATLREGDSLVLFSDGITEAQNASGEEFGDARVLEVLTSAASTSPDVMIDRLFAAIDGFVGDAPQFDDMTILVCRRR